MQGEKKKVEIKPCPFCGQKAYIIRKSHGISHENFCFSAEVGCEDCKFNMTGENLFAVDEFMNINVVKDGIGEMIEQWNRRV